MDLRDYLTTIRDTANAALAELPPAPAPSLYPHLRSDRAAVLPVPLPVPSVDGWIVDPAFGSKIWRVTDALTDPGHAWGTLSAPNQCQVSADDRAFFAMSEDGSTVRFYDVLAGASVPFMVRSEGFFLQEPTFSRIRPGILYAPHYGYTITAYDLATGTRTTLLDVQADVGPLSQDAGQYMGVCYSSRSIPERVACAYGAQQETHPYVTILEVGNAQNRVTLDVRQSRYTLGGGTWFPLVNADGSPANLNVGIHSISIDRSGQWVRIDVSGNAQHVFFHVSTLRIHQWPKNAGDNTWFGHYAWGDQQLVRCLCAPGDAGQFQWLLSDFREAGLPPSYRRLIAQPPANDQNYSDHTNWNHARMDGVLVPVLSGTQRGSAQTGPWKYLDEELCLIATDPQAPVEHYRIAHHRCSYVGFRDSPRPQAFHSGKAALFTSNWLYTLGGRRDLFLVQC